MMEGMKEICSMCLNEFDFNPNEDVYESDNYGNVLVCKICIKLHGIHLKLVDANEVNDDQKT
jgi:hypothetical protein